ncbi:MAG: isoprenylcysteine carboxylmethyltransferase family protein [Synergistaceae bacterium]|jgi:protein-S-isoprenylcysteine O-methyltransferase Ste14|nr:isoprenylcysteine carboxylmethyltransferase family protein [Synergistaceae bacterium]
MGFIARHRTKLSQAIGLFYILLFTFSKKKFETEMPVLTGMMIICGIILVGSGIVGRLWCAQYIAGRKTESLITEGPYSVCRNPLYFFSLLGGTGVGLCTESVILALAIPVLFAVMYPVTILNEERLLMGIHGKLYRDYVSKVPRFIPKWSLFHEPAKYVVDTRIFRREMIDAVYFAYVVGLFEMIEELINAGFIKTFFVLY